MLLYKENILKQYEIEVKKGMYSVFLIVEKNYIVNAPINQYINGSFSGLFFSELIGIFKEKAKNMNSESTLC